ncbi:MAG TPA: RdgB/HAM1 family non-canonical purine NTP pyrophosphatase [Acidimicrobiales bacterium]|nr:RdgB/HAM1 family non-canonical purine NTP pyrophosphatase [Acidimicrobiales bacterium]
MSLVLVLASNNPDKAAEIRAILGTALPGVDLRPRPADLGEVDETGDTLEENARLKAVAIAGATRLPAVADDTGLEVAALDGAPGVRSSRYAGEHATYADNVAKLLAAMAGKPERAARFRTVAIVCWPDGREVIADGAVDGRIATEARGSSGFGYDPVFEPDGGGGLTFAELGPEGKQRLSHRARAFRALAEKLR